MKEQSQNEKNVEIKQEDKQENKQLEEKKTDEKKESLNKENISKEDPSKDEREEIDRMIEEIRKENEKIGQKFTNEKKDIEKDSKTEIVNKTDKFSNFDKNEDQQKSKQDGQDQGLNIIKLDNDKQPDQFQPLLIPITRKKNISPSSPTQSPSPQQTQSLLSQPQQQSQSQPITVSQPQQANSSPSSSSPSSSTLNRTVSPSLTTTTNTSYKSPQLNGAGKANPNAINNTTSTANSGLQQQIPQQPPLNNANALNSLQIPQRLLQGQTKSLPLLMFVDFSFNKIGTLRWGKEMDQYVGKGEKEGRLKSLEEKEKEINQQRGRLEENKDDKNIDRISQSRSPLSFQLSQQLQPTPLEIESLPYQPQHVIELSWSQTYRNLEFLASANTLAILMRCISSTTRSLGARPWWAHGGAAIFDKEYKRRKQLIQSKGGLKDIDYPNRDKEEKEDQKKNEKHEDNKELVIVENKDEFPKPLLPEVGNEQEIEKENIQTNLPEKEKEQNIEIGQVDYEAEEQKVKEDLDQIDEQLIRLKIKSGIDSEVENDDEKKEQQEEKQIIQEKENIEKEAIIEEKENIEVKEQLNIQQNEQEIDTNQQKNIEEPEKKEIEQNNETEKKEIEQNNEIEKKEIEQNNEIEKKEIEQNNEIEKKEIEQNNETIIKEIDQVQIKDNNQKEKIKENETALNFKVSGPIQQRISSQIDKLNNNDEEDDGVYLSEEDEEIDSNEELSEMSSETQQNDTGDINVSEENNNQLQQEDNTNILVQKPQPIIGIEQVEIEEKKEIDSKKDGKKKGKDKGKQKGKDKEKKEKEKKDKDKKEKDKKEKEKEKEKEKTKEKESKSKEKEKEKEKVNSQSVVDNQQNLLNQSLYNNNPYGISVPTSPSLNLQPPPTEFHDEEFFEDNKNFHVSDKYISPIPIQNVSIEVERTNLQLREARIEAELKRQEIKSLKQKLKENGVEIEEQKRQLDLRRQLERERIYKNEQLKMIEFDNENLRCIKCYPPKKLVSKKKEVEKEKEKEKGKKQEKEQYQQGRDKSPKFDSTDDNKINSKTNKDNLYDTNNQFPRVLNEDNTQIGKKEEAQEEEIEEELNEEELREMDQNEEEERFTMREAELQQQIRELKLKCKQREQEVNQQKLDQEDRQDEDDDDQIEEKDNRKTQETLTITKPPEQLQDSVEISPTHISNPAD
ncbi:MAG: hypothetical protein EZS28_029007, partial [Streblomastix strix]